MTSSDTPSRSPFAYNLEELKKLGINVDLAKFVLDGTVIDNVTEIDFDRRQVTRLLPTSDGQKFAAAIQEGGQLVIELRWTNPPFPVWPHAGYSAPAVGHFLPILSLPMRPEFRTIKPPIIFPPCTAPAEVNIDWTATAASIPPRRRSPTSYNLEDLKKQGINTLYAQVRLDGHVVQAVTEIDFERKEVTALDFTKNPHQPGDAPTIVLKGQTDVTLELRWHEGKWPHTIRPAPLSGNCFLLTSLSDAPPPIGHTSHNLEDLKRLGIDPINTRTWVDGELVTDLVEIDFDRRLVTTFDPEGPGIASTRTRRGESVVLELLWDHDYKWPHTIYPPPDNKDTLSLANFGEKTFLWTKVKPVNRGEMEEDIDLRTLANVFHGFVDFPTKEFAPTDARFRAALRRIALFFQAREAAAADRHNQRVTDLLNANNTAVDDRRLVREQLTALAVVADQVVKAIDEQHVRNRGMGGAGLSTGSIEVANLRTELAHLGVPKR